MTRFDTVTKQLEEVSAVLADPARHISQDVDAAAGVFARRSARAVFLAPVLFRDDRRRAELDA